MPASNNNHMASKNKRQMNRLLFPPGDANIKNTNYTT